MKALNKMNNVEKGYCIAQLFPFELRETIEYLKTACQHLKENEEETRQAWKGGLITANFWISLAHGVAGNIDRYGDKMAKRPRLYADHLFDGYLAIYTINVLIDYVDEGNGTPAFQTAIRLFFQNQEP